ncbi:hypothetical protein CW304_15380 [Bacillus sp. UFRGS-B20]|nr:hypothetical protein CW304_15380 [Bacillus sp. UFRGS-B20]
MAHYILPLILFSSPIPLKKLSSLSSNSTTHPSTFSHPFSLAIFYEMIFLYNKQFPFSHHFILTEKE